MTRCVIGFPARGDNAVGDLLIGKRLSYCYRRRDEQQNSKTKKQSYWAPVAAESNLSLSQQPPPDSVL